MRTSRLALAALLPVTVALTALTAACGTSAPVAGGAYGATATTSAASPAMPASSPAPPSPITTARGAPMIPAKTLLTVEKTKIGYVLATGSGMTLYWYGHDVKGSGTSACTGACLTSWPALRGRPGAAAGVALSGKLGMITRADGVVQATYNGYPLYTYAADMTAGQTTGNGVGGVWHVITGAVLSPSPAAAAAASARDMSAAGGGATAPAAPAKPSATMTGY
jgi:predicted lipoprotein with Yx(FWY)xxD motif